MKKQLLTGALLLAAFFGAKAQSSCSDAAALSTGVTSVGTINGEFYEGCYSNSTATAALWYSVTPTENGVYRVNTNLEQNAGGDTRIAVYTGDCDDLTCWSGADDVYYGGPTNVNNNLLTDFQFPVLAGTTYYIAFDNNYVSTGFDVDVTFMPANCSTSSLQEDWSDLSTWYFCWQTIDASGSDNAGDDNGWSMLTDYDFDGDYVPDNTAVIFSGSDSDNNDFLISSAKTLISGTEYTVNVMYNGLDAQDANQNDLPADESFEVLVFQMDGDQFTLVGDGPIGGETGVTQTGSFNQVKSQASTGSYTFTPDADGEYYFAIHSSSAAGTGALGIFEINVDGVMSAPAISAGEFAVYPNPANSVVNVASSKNVISNVSLVDVNGRTVKNASVDGNNAQINISDLASGVYMMTISSDKGSVTKKVVKN